MKFTRTVSKPAVVMACLGMLLPQSAFAAGTQGASKQAKPAVRDIALGQRGVFSGQVVSAENVPVANKKVLVIAKGKKVAETTTDAKGHFSIQGLRAGTYAVGTESTFGIYRTWTASTAPPSAVTAAMLVEDGRVVRGNNRFWYWITDPFVITAALGAAVALPIALNNRGTSS